MAAPEAELPAVAARTAGVEILNRCALDVIREYDSPDTLFYLDPPYAEEVRGSTSDYAFETTDDLHRELADLLASIKGTAAVSGYAGPLYDELFPAPQWTRHESTPRGMGGWNYSTTRTECLWTRNR